MSLKIFTETEIEQLKFNTYVKNVTSKSITYTDEFKLHFISEYNKGVTTIDIFIDAGFDISVLGKRRIHTASNRWRKAYKEKGVMGLRDLRRTNSGRPINRELTQEDIIRRQQAEIEYLKAELDLVKKLELKERSVVENRLKPSYVFSIIQKIINSNKLVGVVSHLCKVGGVSTSGYYSYLKNHDLRMKKDTKDREDFTWILRAYNFKGYKKGSRGIHMTLKNVYGIIFNRKKIQRLMRKFNLFCPIRKANPYRRMMTRTPCCCK